MISSQPTDWVMTVTDLGDCRYLVEIRQGGRLVLRRFIGADAIVVDDELGYMIGEARHRAMTDDRR